MTTTETTTPAAPSAALVVSDGPHELANMTLFNPDMARELVAYANTVSDGSLLPRPGVMPMHWYVSRTPVPVKELTG